MVWYNLEYTTAVTVMALKAEFEPTKYIPYLIWEIFCKKIDRVITASHCTNRRNLHKQISVLISPPHQLLYRNKSGMWAEYK